MNTRKPRARPSTARGNVATLTRLFRLWAIVLPACARPVPASAPLTKPVPSVEETERRSSTRADEGEGSEDKSIEKTEAESTGSDDDSTSGKVTSSRSTERAGTGLSVPASQCAPSAGPPLDCTGLPRGSSTCMGQVLARRVCETVAPSIDPAVASAWASCMRGRVTKSGDCETSRIFDCGLKAIAGACVDGSAQAACAEIAKSCSEFAPEITSTVCERLLGAWKPDKRGSLLECLRRGCDVGDFGACLP